MTGRKHYTRQPENWPDERFDFGRVSRVFVSGNGGADELSSETTSSCDGTDYSDNTTAADNSFGSSEVFQSRERAIAALGDLSLEESRRAGRPRAVGRKQEHADNDDDASIEGLKALVRALRTRNRELELNFGDLERVDRSNAQPWVDNEALWQEIGDLRAQVANLNEANGRLGEKAGQLAEERDELRAQLQGKAIIEAQFREMKLRISRELDASKEQCSSLQEDCKHLKTFAQLGVYVRSRLLEWEHPRALQNEDLIDAGSRCAHYGMCHADALLYTNTMASLLPGVKERRDNDVYRKLYGVEPAMMLKYRDNRKLMEAFNMRCTLKRFLIAEAYDESRFRAYWKEAWAKAKTRKDMSVEGLKKLLETPEMEVLWAKMRAEYENADMDNKKKRLEAKLEAKKGK